MINEILVLIEKYERKIDHLTENMRPESRDHSTELVINDFMKFIEELKRVLK